MITNEKIKDILISALKSDPVFGMIHHITKDVHARVKEGNVPERIVVVIPGGSDNGEFQRSFPRICVYVPYIKFKADKSNYYVPDNKRLAELEKQSIKAFRSAVYGKLNDEDVFLYAIEDIVQEDDPETWSNFLNIRLRFEVVNTKL